MFRIIRALRSAALGFALPFALGAPALSAGLPPAPQPVASFDSGSLHVDEYGSGARSMVLIPGLGSGPWEWYGTIDAFSKDYTIYALTLSGFDGRSFDAKAPLFPGFENDFWNLLDTRKIEKPVVVGHSLGGTLAIVLGEEHPERLAGIVAIDGLPVFPTLANATADQRSATAQRMGAMYAALSPAQELQGEVQYMKTVGTNRTDLVEPTAQLEARSDPKAMAAWMQEDLSSDFRPGLVKISTPFLEMMPYDPGANYSGGPSYTQEQTLAYYQSLVSGAPGAKVVAIAPAKHFAMLDQPDAVYAALRSFLASLP